MTGKDRSEIDSARRHLLGLTAATTARIVAMGSLAGTIISSSSAEAGGRAWWKKGGDKPGKGPGKNPMCLLRGTSIMTPKGEVPVEELRIGDLVETIGGKALPIKWIGLQTYKCRGPTWNMDVVPIRISPSALDEGTPKRKLYLSPGHSLYIDGVLIRAKDLVNGTTIVPELPADSRAIEYFQILLDAHQVILAEGAPVESFQLNADNYEGFTNFAEFARLYPADVNLTMSAYAPIVGYGGREHLKALLRLASAGLIRARTPTRDAHVRLAARGERIAC
ncbi:Hint domain-containing protein [Neorhizobium petrolearium]|uniref:Hint domain-containing protein n=1 Tax=Neorhizobium petrolearium TaxID=515361 RepID=A0ABY8LWI2_9HYPH|nr:Hint domain-containing protein [Neorhizobium petrolearium]MCC2611498.1 Hint domain-containing protein [Neorhizobium petrolearium]WGI66688.1 Hint domain-containing protein [Neorhizobium petrolearium]